MGAETAAFLNAAPLGYHACGAQWGYAGEHRQWRTTYECPRCHAYAYLYQCAAWPITETDCAACGARMACEVPGRAVAGSLR